MLRQALLSVSHSAALQAVSSRTRSVPVIRGRIRMNPGNRTGLGVRRPRLMGRASSSSTFHLRKHAALVFLLSIMWSTTAGT